MDLLIRKGNQSDIEAFISLLQEVRDAMEHKEWFYLDSPEDVRSMMKKGIMDLWVAMAGDKMVAGFDFLRPGKRCFNYGYDLALSEEDLSLVINMDSAAVHPEYRGQGLQQKLIRCAEDQIRCEGRRILLCTVHPDNRVSLEIVLRQGYAIQKKIAKYGSVRYILRKDIKK